MVIVGFGFVCWLVTWSLFNSVVYGFGHRSFISRFYYILFGLGFVICLLSWWQLQVLVGVVSLFDVGF